MSSKDLRNGAQNNITEYFKTWHNKDKTFEDKPIMISSKTDEAIIKAVTTYVKKITSKPSENVKPTVLE